TFGPGWSGHPSPPDGVQPLQPARNRHAAVARAAAAGTNTDRTRMASPRARDNFVKPSGYLSPTRYETQERLRRTRYRVIRRERCRESREIPGDPLRKMFRVRRLRRWPGPAPVTGKK